MSLYEHFKSFVIWDTLDKSFNCLECGSPSNVGRYDTDTGVITIKCNSCQFQSEIFIGAGLDG